MGKPLQKTSLIKNIHADEISNPSRNTAFSQVLETCLSRRRLLMQGSALGMAAGLVACRTPLNGNAIDGRAAGHVPHHQPAGPAPTGVVPANNLGKATTLAFESIPMSASDTVIVPPGYTARAFYKWGDPVGIARHNPAFKSDASNSARDQRYQAGMHHDGMAFFPLPRGSRNSQHGLLAINHEYVDNGLLFPDGTANWNLEKVRKSQNAMGISVVEVATDRNGQWQVIRPSNHARRITPHTPMDVSGPARGHPLMRTREDPEGIRILGTMQNCANGQTPWGTYLTCEENWADIFITPDRPTSLEQRYGIGQEEEAYRWHEFDARFNAGVHPNEPNRFGWVVEIDPYEPHATPVKHTALGRIKHEGATVTIAPDGRVVVYTGDDQRFEYIYKFVSKGIYDPHDRAANKQLLTEGTLYAARFDEDGRGEWVPLVHGQRGLTPENGFADQGEVLIKTRLAADQVGATPMDRPEWMAIDPYQPGSVYCTLTNNKDRGAGGKPGTDAANPRAGNLFGHIIHWQEADGNAASNRFRWDMLVLAGRHDTTDPAHRGNMLGAEFGSPDGLSFDHRGVLWIQTDVSASTMNAKAYGGMGNNQMVATLPGSNRYKRFLTGPNGAEITGIAFAPDNRTMFVNIQHPGEPKEGDSDPKHPTALSTWPDGPSGGRPRAATVVITKDDGGVIGS